MISLSDFLGLASRGFCCGFFIGLLSFVVRQFRVSMRAAVSGSGGLF